MRPGMKILFLGFLAGALLATGFAIGYPIGSHSAFEAGSEWALLQAKLVARDAGVIMPVYLKNDQFHVLLRSVPDDCRKEEGSGNDQSQDKAEDVIQAGATVTPDGPPPAAGQTMTGEEHENAVPGEPWRALESDLNLWEGRGSDLLIDIPLCAASGSGIS